MKHVINEGGGHIKSFLDGLVESPKNDHIQRTFSNLFGILASRNDQIWPPPSFITCFIAFLDVFSTKMVDKISRTNDESLSSPSPYLETISNPNKWFCDLPIRDWWRHQNRWIFRKVPYCLCTPPPQFFQCYAQKALFWVQNLQYNFLDWKWPLPPFGTFPKIHPIWKCGASLS